MTNLSAPFINRPIATSLIGLAIALSGILGFCFLPVAPLPQIEFPTIIVQASMPGASPEVMASSVATPIEKELTKIAGISDMTSSSALGSVTIVVQFDLSRTTDSAAQDIESAINDAMPNLPSNLQSTPTYRKVNPADAPILIMSLSSDIFPMDEVYDVASTKLQQKLLQLPGVGQVIVGGGASPAVRVELDLPRLAIYGLTSIDVENAITANSTLAAKGIIMKDGHSYEIALDDQLTRAHEYAEIIVASSSNGYVRLKDIAKVVDSTQNIRNGGLLNKKRAIALVIFKSPGSNVIQAVDGILGKMAELRSMIPAGISLDVVLDRTTVIRASLHDVEKTLIISCLLVILVVYLFLRDIRATFIPASAMILSLLGTFAFMKLFGFTLDNFSLLALTIATGFVVDDAIVVLENITRYAEKGENPKNAALKGSGEICFTVVSMSLSIIAVFIPILFMGGLIGRLFREFAITLSIAILVSLFVSITITPMLCSIFISKDLVKRENQRFDYLKLLYEISLKKVLKHQGIALCSLVLAVGMTIALFIIVPKGFFPQQDTGRIIGTLVTDQSASFSVNWSKFEKYMNIISSDENVAGAIGFVGTGSTNAATIFINLKPKSERNVSSDDLIAILRKKLAPIAGSTVFLQTSQDIVIGGRPGNAQYQYTISSGSIEDLKKYTPLVLEEMRSIPGIVDLSSDLKDRGLESYIDVNQERAAQLGLNMRDIDRTLYGLFGQALNGTIYKEMNEYYVVVEADLKFLEDPDSLKYVYVKSNTGALVPLSSFATISTRASLLAVNHQGLAPCATLSFNISKDASLGDISSMVNDRVSHMKLPSGMHAGFRGTIAAFSQSFSSQPLLILTALLAVYIVLGMVYESFIHPITIISTIPSAGVGALIALLVTGTDLSVITVIAMLLLIGIVKKNAIMMIDFVLEIKRRGDDLAKCGEVGDIASGSHLDNNMEAVIEASLLRFRPIMMTTMCALLGAVPIAFGTGVGAEMRRPLGIAIIGGLLVSQALTLYTTPVMYLALERVSGFFRRGAKPEIQ